MTLRAKLCYLFLYFAAIFAPFISMNCSGASLAAGQNVPFDFRNLKFRNSENSGFATIGQVWAMVEDNQGFLWVSGARGVGRYDGLNLKIFQNDSKDENSVPEGYIADIIKARDGRIWVASQKGLYELLPDEERFVRRPLIFDGQEVTSLWALAEHADGGIWVGYTGEGIGRLDPRTGEFTRYFMDQRDASESNLHNTYAVLVDRTGKVWWGNEYGVKRFDPLNDTMASYKFGRGTADSLASGTVNGIAEDGNGNIWVGTTGGLSRFDESSGGFTRYEFDPNSVTSLSGNNVSDIAVDGQNNLWVSVDGAGLNLYLPQSDGFRRFQASDDALGSIKADGIRRLFVNSAGQLWLGFHPYGIAVVDRFGSAFEVYQYSAKNHNSVSGNSINALYQSGPDDLWLGGEAGVNHIHLPSRRITRYTHSPDDPHSLSSNAVLTVYVDSSNRLWVGTWSGGLNVYDAETKRFRHYKQDPNNRKSLPSNNVWIVRERDKNSLWVGTSAGLAIFDVQKEEFEKVRGFNHRVGNLAHWGSDHLVVVDDNGLHLLNAQTLQVDLRGTAWAGLPKVVNAHVNAAGEIWISTEKGFKRQRSPGGALDHFTQIGELANRYYSQIVTDSNGVLWLGDTDGITSFNEASGRFIRFNSHYGLPGNSFRSPRAALLLQDGRLAMGGADGLAIFLPSATYTAVSPARPVLTGLKVLDRKVSVGSVDSPLRKVINRAESIELGFHQNVFSIEYSALEFQLAKMNGFRFMLEGFDPDWREVGDQRVATYTNLNPGRYRFRVQVSDDQGIWGQDDASVEVIIQPPWWRTWWAYALYAAAALLLVFWYLHGQWQKRRAVELQNKLLEAKVAERTVELRKKNNDVQAMLGSIQQGLFTIGEGGVVNPEYSIFLERIYGTQSVADRNAMEFLFEGADIGADRRSQAEEAVASIVGEDAINYDFNCHLLVKSYSIVIGGEIRHLELDWSPIVAGDLVEKLMVAVRDVTDIRKIEAEARLQRKEIDIISQLLDVPAQRFLRFEKSTKNFLRANRALISQRERSGAQLAVELFRNMHTIKGNCRALNFSHIGDVAHQAELRYSGLRSIESDSLDLAVLSVDLDSVERELVHYSRVYRHVLGRNSSVEMSDGIWLDRLRLENFRSSLLRLERKAPELIRSLDFAPIRDFFSLARTVPFTEALDDVARSLPSIARQLEKCPPHFDVHADQLYLREEIVDVVSDVFVHLTRNSLDHGIETPVERERVGKSAVGTIEIGARQEGSHVHITFSDDGRGVDLEALFAKGVEAGIWRSGDQPGALEISNLMFHSGVTSKLVATQVSGRGVGLDAVRAFVEGLGGDISVELLDEGGNGCRFVPFRLQLSIPATHFVSRDAPLSMAS